MSKEIKIIIPLESGLNYKLSKNDITRLDSLQCEELLDFAEEITDSLFQRMQQLSFAERLGNLLLKPSTQKNVIRFKPKK